MAILSQMSPPSNGGCAGRIRVKYWSNTGQILVKYCQNCGAASVGRACIHTRPAGRACPRPQTAAAMIKYWSNNGQIMVK
jgi:hypothetical protein